MRLVTVILIVAKVLVVLSVDLPGLGQIQGGNDQTFGGRQIHTFLGVPYATPPVGRHRFEKPEAVTPWNGTWTAKTVFKCMQYNQYTPPGEDFVVGDEDCLYLNIYTPSLDPKSNLDVLVYIHGGSFMFNYAALYGPGYLLDEDVVLVTINYRLGPLGFLSTEDDIVPGNNGLKDQILALEFVKTYIKHFGGNPNSLTIWGNSAGGASVHFHYLIPKSRNLFNRGISQSGTALVPWSLMEGALVKTQKLANGLGCPTQTSSEMIKCLKTRPARQIVGSVKDFQPWLYIPFSPFAPVADVWATDPLFPAHPYSLLRTKQVYDVPWIVSFTNAEGLYPAEEFYYDDKYLNDIDTRWNQLLPLILDYNFTVTPQSRDEVSQTIRRKYLTDLKLTKSTFPNFLTLLSERIFLNGIQEAAQIHSSATRSAVFCYEFAYRGANSWFQSEDDDFGAAHADDVPYVLAIPAVNTTSTENDRQMSELLVRLVTSYAKAGTPGIDWPAVTPDLRRIKIVAPGKILVETGSVSDSQFWEALPIMENSKLFKQPKDEL